MAMVLGRILYSRNNTAILICTLGFLVSLLLSSCANESRKGGKSFGAGKAVITITAAESIRIEVVNASLHDTLEAINTKSHIDFEVNEQLLQDVINTKIDSPDWPGAMKKLLVNYNYANSWRGDVLERIFIFETGTGKSIELRPPPVFSSSPMSPGTPPGVLEEGQGKEMPDSLPPEFLAAPPVPPGSEGDFRMVIIGQKPQGWEEDTAQPAQDEQLPPDEGP